MVALARALRDDEAIGAYFALNGSEDAAVAIRRAGFPVTMLRANCDLEAVIDAHGPDILLLDGREGPDRATLKNSSAALPSPP